MKDYASKDFLHPQIALAERVVGYSIIAGLVLVIGWMQQRDAAHREQDLAQAALSLCQPAPGEIASIAPTKTGYECAIKRGHQIVSRYEI